MSIKEQFNKDLKATLERKLPTKGALTLASWLTAICLIALIWFIIDYSYTHRIFHTADGVSYKNTGSLGTFGDFIGGVIGTILSFVTVILVWLTYQSQKEELKELRDVNKEQIEIQALSALMVHYTNKIQELKAFLSPEIYFEADKEYIESSIKPAERHLKHYEYLLLMAEELLIVKSQSLFAHRHHYVKGVGNNTGNQTEENQ